MDELIADADNLTPPQPGTLVEGTVISVFKNKVLVDLVGFATGVITGQEAHDSLGTVKNLKPGDTVSSYVLEEENEDGLVVLSLRKASQEKTWNRFRAAYDEDTSIKVVPTEANKGGLLLNIDGIKGFIPVSQLAPLHYPRVDGADSNEILNRLQKLVGVELTVKIINLDSEGGKLILSEKAAERDLREEAISKLDIGQKINGKISGIVKFGIFVTFDGLEGLVHISEIAWGHVKDPNDFGKLGNEVEVLIIGKDNDKISLSMKRLVPDPWVDAAKKYKVGTIIKGPISRITPFGAFIKLDKEINGLIHISEISEDESADINKILKAGDVVEAKVITIDPDDHRVGLSIKALTEASAKEDSNDKEEPTKEADKKEAKSDVKEDVEDEKTEDSAE